MTGLNETLYDVAEEVFESLAFILLMLDEEPAQTDGGTEVVARIEFSGHFEGALFESVSAEMLPAIAANMLGLEGDPPPSPDQQSDALKELLNVICGNFLPRIASAEAVFDVRAAEILSEGKMPRTARGQPSKAKAELNLEEGRAELAFFAFEAVSGEGDTPARPAAKVQ